MKFRISLPARFFQDLGTGLKVWIVEHSPAISKHFPATLMYDKRKNFQKNLKK
jgi:hypothetical protein